MSKQVKLKFKKLLKNAEFVYADLEYHEELLPDAKQGFFEAAQKVLDTLPDHIQKEINDKRNQKIIESLPQEDEEDENNESVDASTSLLPSDTVAEAEAPTHTAQQPEALMGKESEVKKMFRAIAAVSHPDKLGGNTSQRERAKLDKVFKKARIAYRDNNWFLLHSLCLDLDIDVAKPGPEHLQWLEEDIRITMEEVARIETLLVWVWYTGDEESKNAAIQNYFQQVYDYTLTGALSAS